MNLHRTMGVLMTIFPLMMAQYELLDQNPSRYNVSRRIFRDEIFTKMSLMNLTIAVGSFDCVLILAIEFHHPSLSLSHGSHRNFNHSSSSSFFSQPHPTTTKIHSLHQPKLSFSTLHPHTFTFVS